MSASVVAQVAAAPIDADSAFFEKSIRPVLVKHCYECHSADAAAKGNLKAGLLLDTRQGLLDGGESGPAIVPKAPDKSLLIGAIKHQSYEMPPTGRLPAAVIADFVKWVEMGAPDPRDSAPAAAPTPRRTAFAITAEDRRHWAFQPLDHATPPSVGEAAWVRSDIDRFVLAGIERAGFRPAPEADKPTLLRRVTFTLTGLPPTPEEIAAFLADDRPDAFDHVVDRLLESGEFGVHWGRHWLDGVRYANNIDKSGEYRRWVVRACNQDLPYDKFIKLQIAGDLYPAGSDVPAERIHVSGSSFDGITATGMMAFAVWEQVGRDLAVAEIVDSQIDLVGRQLLGLTLACARCHDHKFDPISTQDYYSLAGILFSSHIATGKLIADDRLGSDFVELSLLNADQAAHNRKLDADMATLTEEIAALTGKIPQAVRLADITAERADLAGQLAKATSGTTKKSLEDKVAKLKTEEDKLLTDQMNEGWEKSPAELQEIAALRTKVAELRRSKIAGMAVVTIAEGGVPGSNRERIGDAPVYLRGEYQREGAIVPRRFPVVLAGDTQTPIGNQTKQSGRRELAEWIASAENPLTARVMVNRIWQQMIGRALVRSPDNFGKLGERPTHPELLDYLSQRFIESRWSVKRVIRDIALSATFRQASFTSPDVVLQDPDNRTLSHMNRRRLTYEEFRDTLLKLGSQVAETSAKTSSASPDKTAWRTMYTQQDRLKTDVNAAIFDGPDSKAIVPARSETTTAQQALFLMNNSLALETARRLTAELSASASTTTDEQRLEKLWLMTLGRIPEVEEVKIARGFIAEHSWERFIQALLSTNEFAYID
jgi:cytochrome c553